MKNHLWRPLLVVIVLIVLAFIGRYMLVPKDFGIHGESFTYNYYRLSDVDWWKNFKVKYQGRELCADCHEENYEKNQTSKHKIIQCENCHGPAIDHPDNPELLAIERGRELCYRCHAYLPYPGNKRAEMRAIDPQEHNTEDKCVECHDPHQPNLEDM